MAVLTVKEYNRLARDAAGQVMVMAPLEPAIRSQAVSLSGTAARTSNGTGSDCFFVGITSDVNCHVEFGDSAVDAVVATSEFLLAGDTKYFGVDPAVAVYVSGITP